jgi:signal peptidase
MDLSMTALRWTRRALDALLVVAVVAVIVTAALQLLAPLAGGRALAIGGGSMEPTIGRGALVVALPAGPEGYAVGDVVAVRQGGATPYTHRITRLADLDGVPYVETKGDANAGPDPAIVPTAAVIGRIVVSVPLLGYLALLLGTVAGLAGFIALCASALILAWLSEDLEAQRCSACAAVAAVPPPGSMPEGGLLGAGAFGALPAAAAPVWRARVRDTGRARDAATPVLLERDRRDPRRHGTVTFPAAPATPVGAPDEAAADDRHETANDDREEAA